VTPRRLDIAYPLHTAATGRTGSAAPSEHIRQMIVQLVLTSPGERVMRPGFGGGVAATLFEPASDALVAMLRYQLQASLGQELGDVIEVQEISVEVAAVTAGEIDVAVGYRILESDRVDAVSTTVRVTP
jgi:phage baseplate assembly protein W